VDVHLEAQGGAHHLVRGGLVHAPLHVVAGEDAGDVTGRRKRDLAGDVLAARAGIGVGGDHPGVVHGGVAGVELSAELAHVAGNLPRRGVEDGDAVGAATLGVGDEGVHDAARGVDVAVRAGAGCGHGGHVFQAGQLPQCVRVV